MRRYDQRDVYDSVSMILVACIRIAGIPMKHDPLGDGDDAVLRLTERSQLRLDSVV